LVRADLARCRTANASTISALNTLLGKSGLSPLLVTSVAPDPKCVE